MHWLQCALVEAKVLQQSSRESRKMRKTAPDAERDMPTLSEMDGVRCLHFDSPWIQGAMQVSNPSSLVFLYTRQMMGWLLFLSTTSVKRIDMLGLGAGSLARYCLRHTKAHIHCVEWNPAVTAFCQQYFKLPRSHKRLAITHADAQDWVVDMHNHGASQVLLVDLYDYTAQGPVADSLEFYENCYRVLDNCGILVVNLFGHHPSYRKNLRHIKQAFQQRVLAFDETEDGNRIVLAFKGPILAVEQEELLKRARVVERHSELEAVSMAQMLIPQMEKNARKAKVSPNVLVV
ncbi:spermidine synthase [Pelistega europaea]|uniref:spermine/spermidine synthase domain-containing protein n=1 Tax=Pelistega europaea TaxID=106147 RepID=UPI001C121A8D|nr:spermidine synthase [Pelistega europaea]